MEEKLEAHRAKKRRQALFNKYKNYLFNMVSFQNHTTIDINSKKNDDEGDDNRSIEQYEIGKLLKDQINDHESENTVIDSGELVSPWTSSEDEETVEIENTKPVDKSELYFKYFTWFLYTCFWGTCYMIAIELKFGTVFLLFSALFGIYFNTRTTPRKRNEISAYSVFNDNCQSIDGTLKAEQFEREIRYGPASVR